MKSVIDNINEIIINKSKFITLTYQINDIEDVNKKLEFVKKMYKDATHYCYAYIINNQEKSEDDGEPSGTAGNPILNVLQKEKLNNVLCIVVRYFGGIKLGAGGLVRAYSKACKESLIIKSLNKGYLINIKFNYKNIKEIDYLLNNSLIINKTFLENSCYDVNITIEEFEKIKDKLKQISEITIIKNIFL